MNSANALHVKIIMGNEDCNNGCGSSGKELAEVKNEVAELNLKLSALYDSTKFFQKMHPIFAIQNADDIALFNMTTGIGTGVANNLVVCNGNTYYSNSVGKNITTPNLLDKFIICAGEDYPVNTTGGAATVTLTTSQMPSHNHTVTENGHTHDISDPGHNHGANAGSHTHTITSAPHTHVAENESAHIHPLGTAVTSIDYNGGTGPYGPAFGALASGTNYGGLNTSAGSAHTHIIDAANVNSTASSETLSVTVSDAFVGITETEPGSAGVIVNAIGGGLPHENMPPYYSLIYVMKL